jgi:hypothetical protein
VRESDLSETLYIVLIVAANTKYSINSFFLPVPSASLVAQKIVREHLRAVSGSSTQPPAHDNAIFRLEPTS